MKNNDISKIEKLLVKKEFVYSEEIEDAKKEAEHITEKALMPVCLILSKEHGLKNDDLSKILEHNDLYEDLVCFLTEDKDLVKNKELQNFIDKNENPAQLVNLLYEKGLIVSDKKKFFFNKLLNLKKAAQVAVDSGFISVDDLEEAFKKKNEKKSFCEILYENHLVTLSELNHIFISIDNSLRLGEILLNLGLINQKTLEKTLTAQKKSGLTMGNILINQGAISVNQLYFALSIQYNIPFRELTDFVYSDSQKIELENLIKKETAEENFIIPLLLTGRNLTLGFFSPFHIGNINELIAEYDELDINCVLVTHNKFEQLHALLYGNVIKVTNDLIKQDKTSSFSIKKVLISDPESQYRQINDFFERYLRREKSETGKIFNSDKNLFHEFIIKSYSDICYQYNCRKVAFWIDFSGKKLSVMASPVYSG